MCFVQQFHRINLRYKIGFLSTVIVGLLAHLVGMVNKFSFHDDISMLFGAGSLLPSGRWMLHLLHETDKLFYGTTAVSIPFFNGLISLLFLGLSVCLILYFLDIQKPVICIGIAGVMSAFPVICSLFGYFFTAHYYLIGMFFCILGVVLFYQKPWYCKLLGVLLQACSVGVYQAYIPIILSVLVLKLFTQCWENRFTYKEFFKACFILAANCIAFILVYFLINRIFLTVTHTELLDYRGVDTMGQEPLSTYLKRAIAAYRYFLLPNPKANIFPFRLQILYWAAIAFSVLHCVIRAIELKSKNSLFMLLCVLILPLATNFIYVMCAVEDIHTLMLYGQVGVLLLLAFTSERTTWKHLKHIGVLILVICSVMFIRLDNAHYVKAEMTQTQTIQYYTAMIAQIKSTEGYEDTMQVALIGDRKNTDSTAHNITGFEQFNLIPYKNFSNLINDYTIRSFLSNWCGFSPRYNYSTRFVSMEEFIEMPCYPDQGSIKVIDGVLVVKISN